MKINQQFILFSLAVILFFGFMHHNVFAQTVTIEADDLLVRKGPATTYEPIGHVNQDESYPLLDETDDWIAIDYDGQTGWVSRQYVSIIDQETVTNKNLLDNESSSIDTSTGDLSNIDTFKLPVDRVHLRSEATTQSEILAVLSQGQKVTIVEKTNDDWIKVNWQDKSGFIPSWLIDYKSNKVNKLNSSLKDKVIVIDPGHGGDDVGTISITDNYEKKYTLYTSQILKNQLELLGAKVYYTREDDFYYALTPRPLLANYLAADVFLSIHYNSEPQHPSASGINTYHLKDADQDLASYVHQGLIDNTGANDRGIATGDYLVLRLSKRPGLLLELGFLSNDHEEKEIQSPDYQLKISEGIVEGLENYFSNH